MTLDDLEKFLCKHKVTNVNISASKGTFSVYFTTQDVYLGLGNVGVGTGHDKHLEGAINQAMQHLETQWP